METKFLRKESIIFKDHPKYEDVKISLLVTSKDTKKIGISMLEIAPGTEIPIHIHETQVDSIYVLEGSGEVYVNGKWESIKQGDYVFVPETLEHGVRNTGKEALKLFIAHSPPLF